MAKKKKKKSNKKKSFFGISELIGGGFRILFRSVPMMMVIAGGVGLFLGVKGALYADSALAVDRIVIQPGDALTDTERQSIDRKWLGQNILSVDLDQIARQLEVNPDIQTARVIRHLPSKLKIEIEEREAIAFIQFAPKGIYGLISEDGMILDTVKTINSSYVLIDAYGLSKKAPRRGMRFSHRGYDGSIAFLQAFWEHPLARRETVTKISLDHLGNVTVTLGSQPNVRLGRHPIERLPALEKIQPILEGPERTQIDYIDLQFDDVIVKRKNR